MTIELNLVNNGMYPFNNVFELITRKRVTAELDDDVLSAVATFISENISTIDTATSDKNLVNMLQNLQKISISEFMTIKYILAQVGLDVLVYVVADEEINPLEIPTGTYEYNIIDTIYPDNTFLNRSTKVSTTSDQYRISEVYSKIQEMYGFFENELTAPYANLLSTPLSIIRENEELVGKADVNQTTNINTIFEYLGKQIIVIVNQLQM